MAPRILTPLGVTYIGYSKDTIEAYFGPVDGHRTTLRMPRDLSLKATRLREDFGCSDNDIFVVALAEWMDTVDGERAGGANAHMAPEVAPHRDRLLLDGHGAADAAVIDDLNDTLDDLLTRPPAWTFADRAALKDFRNRVVDALVLILVDLDRRTAAYDSLIRRLPVGLKLEALSAGGMLDVTVLRDILRPRFRARRSHKVDGLHYRFEDEGPRLALRRCEPSGRPRLVRPQE